MGQPAKESDRSNKVGFGAMLSPRSHATPRVEDGGGSEIGVSNIFHHQLDDVSITKRKKFEFTIRTQYDAENDPMARPDEKLQLRAPNQEEFEKWVDALTTWSQSLQAMSLLRF